MKYEREQDKSKLSPEQWLDQQIDDIGSMLMSVELALAEATDQNSPDRFRLLQEFTVISARAINLVELSATYAETGVDGIVRLFDIQCALLNLQDETHRKTSLHLTLPGKLISQTMVKEIEAKLADTGAFKQRLELKTL